MNSAAVRTQGDGIENSEVKTTEGTHKVVRKASVEAKSVANIDKLGKDYLSKQTTSATILYDPTGTEDQNFNYPPAVQPKGKRFYLIPKLVKQNQLTAGGLKNRKLSLVLMEPYRVICFLIH